MLPFHEVSKPCFALLLFVIMREYDSLCTFVLPDCQRDIDRAVDVERPL